MNEIIQVLMAFLGSLGFTIVFGCKKSHIIFLSLGGALSWIVYLISSPFVAFEPAKYFIATVFVALYAEIFARILKTPTTDILIPALVPLIPGGALYYTIRYAFSSEWQSFLSNGSLTLGIAFAIALGVIAVSIVSKLVYATKRKES